MSPSFELFVFGGAEPDIVLAQLLGATDEMMFGGGAVLMVAGLYLRWMLPEYRMTAEERTKEGRWSERQAHRRIMLVRFGGPAAVLVGLVCFAALFAG